MRKKKFSFRRLATKMSTIKNGALECIRDYPAVKRDHSNRLVDIVSIVCVLGISVITIVFTFSA